MSSRCLELQHFMDEYVSYLRTHTTSQLTRTPLLKSPVTGGLIRRYMNSRANHIICPHIPPGPIWISAHQYNDVSFNSFGYQVKVAARSLPQSSRFIPNLIKIVSSVKGLQAVSQGHGCPPLFVLGFPLSKSCLILASQYLVRERVNICFSNLPHQSLFKCLPEATLEFV